MNFLKPVMILVAVMVLVGCASQETNTQVPAQRDAYVAQTAVAQQPAQTTVLKRKVAIGRFTNETEYGKGVFYNKENDPMEKQAVDILSAKLTDSGKFILLERADADVIQNEIDNYDVKDYRKIGADFIIVGSINEFGRKTTGEAGIFTSKQKQTVQAGVNIRLIDVSTGLIVYSEEGKGEAEIETVNTLGFGAEAGYDATLSDKAISAAISKLVENIINKCMDLPWTSYFISYSDKMIVIGGGAEQGIQIGSVFQVYEKGEVVTNPQTGMQVVLPGDNVGSVKVIKTGGTNAADGYSIVEFVSGSIDPSDLSRYEVRDK